MQLSLQEPRGGWTHHKNERVVLARQRADLFQRCDVAVHAEHTYNSEPPVFRERRCVGPFECITA